VLIVKDEFTSKDWILQWGIALGKEELPKTIGALLLLVRHWEA
jgi:hypothetical protein